LLTLAGLGPSPVAGAVEPAPVVLTAAGDIDGCQKGEDTAELLAKTTGPVATIGDYAYPEGTADAIDRCYDPTWGAYKDRTHPVPGNHDYDVPKATPYYEYFGTAAGELGKGWYSYDVGSWHVVGLNSNCGAVNCDEQSEWLERDLQAHPSACILAYWHHPRFSSGQSGGDSSVGGFWKVLYNHGAALVLNGHDHNYERFAPQDPSGRRDPEKGIREFVVGTGGAGLGSLGSTAPNSEVRSNRAYGVLELTLRSDGYDWRFVPVADDDFTDSGSGTCPGTAPAATTPPPTEAAPPPPPSEPEPPAPAVEDPEAVAPGPAAPAPPASSDPPVNGRRQPRTAPTTAPPRATRPERSAGSGSQVAKPAAPRAAAPPASPATGSPASPAEPAPLVSDQGAEAPQIQSVAEPPELPEAAPESTDADSSSLALAISGLVKQAPPPARTDRRGITAVAISLMAVDCIAIGTLRRRRPDIFNR
jgi:hypothetical protein